MKYMLIVLITMGSPIIGEDKKTLELRIPQESKQECEKSAQTFKFHLSAISMDTKCEPRKVNEEPSLRSI